MTPLLLCPRRVNLCIDLRAIGKRSCGRPGRSIMCWLCSGKDTARGAKAIASVCTARYSLLATLPDDAKCGVREPVRRYQYQWQRAAANMGEKWKRRPCYGCSRDGWTARPAKSRGDFPDAMARPDPSPKMSKMSITQIHTKIVLSYCRQHTQSGILKCALAAAA